MRKLLVTLDNGKTGTFEVPTELSQEEAWDQIAADIPKGTAIANIRQISGATETPASNDVSPALKLRREMLSQYYGGDLDQLASKYNNMDTRKALLDKVGDLSKKQQIIGLMDVYNGVSPSDENSSTNQYFNEFNSMLGKEIDYRLENKQGITAGNVVFPELSRRVGTDASTLSKVLGGIKDVVTLPARAGRSAIEELMPLSGQYTYAERMAMPEKYKTGIQQMGDEMLSFSNLPNMAAGKAVNLASRAPVIGSKIGKIANMGLKPADIVLGNTPSFASSLGRSIAKDAPSIGADIGYELTKPADETGGGVNAGMIALGSLFGHALPVAAKSKLGTPQSTMEWLAPQSYLKSQLEPFKTKAYMDYPSTLAIQGGPTRNINDLLNRTRDDIIDYDLFGSSVNTKSKYGPYKGEEAAKSTLRDMQQQDAFERARDVLKRNPADAEAAMRNYYSKQALTTQAMLPNTPEITGNKAVGETKALDDFYKNVAESALNKPNRKAEFEVYNNIINTAKRRLKKGDTLDVDFITPSVMNAITNEGFWKAANPNLTDGVVTRLANMGKDFIARGAFDNVARRTIASALKNYVANDDMFTSPSKVTTLGDLQ